MIAINGVILVILVLNQVGTFCEAADVTEARGFPQFLRRRRTNSNPVAVEENTSPKILADLNNYKNNNPSDRKKRLFFGLRSPQRIEEQQVQQRIRTKSNEKPPSVESNSGYMNYFISSAISGITKALDVIEDLEKDYISKVENEECPKDDTNLPLLKRQSSVNKFLTGDRKSFTDDEGDDGSESGGSSGFINEKMMASGITINEEDGVTDDFDRNSVNSLGDSLVITENPLASNELVESTTTTTITTTTITAAATITTKTNDCEEKTIEISLKNDDYNVNNLAAENEKNLEYEIISDSDSESWEQVSSIMRKNVTLMTDTPEVVDLIDKYFNRKTLIEFLKSVFVKFARKIFFRPSSHSTNLIMKYPLRPLNLNEPPEDYVTIFNENELETDKSIHQFLDYESAQKVLFYGTIDSENDDWEFVPLRSSDFNDALEYTAKFLQVDINQIDLDLPRLPERYYDFYAERRGRTVNENDSDELKDKIKSLLAFIMAFEAKAEPISDFEGDSAVIITKAGRIFYSQGFEQIAAYFAINFDLNLAGSITYRFFQTYLQELINVPVPDVRKTFQKIDGRAVLIIREYLKDQFGKYDLNFEALFGILEFFPFSDNNATLLYFNSVTNFTDLDRLIQFLLFKVPRSQAHKSISLLAAANMLYCIISLDGLLNSELGSEDWAQLKAQIYNVSTSEMERKKVLDILCSKFMCEMFISTGNKIVHPEEEFKDFLKSAEALIPYLSKFD